MKVIENTQEKDPAQDVGNKESIGTDWRECSGNTNRSFKGLFLKPPTYSGNI